MSKKSRITLLISLATALLLLYSETFATKKTVDVEAGSSYTTLSAAISASSSGDTIYIQGSDIDSYDETWPSNIGWALTIMSDKTSPDSFPSIKLSGTNWDQYWANFGGTNRFEAVILNNCGAISLTRADRNCIINRCIIKNYSSNVFSLGSNHSNYLTITNTIFWNNTGTIFPQLSDHNNNGPYGTVFNCTFYGNSVINSENNVSSYEVTCMKIVVIANSIFKGNSTIVSDADIKTAYTYNLLPSTESGWGTGSVYNDNPGFINSSPAKASDFGLQSGSPAIDKATSTGAPTTDIAGNSRSGSYDIGCWEGSGGGGGGTPDDYATWSYSKSITLNTTSSGANVSGNVLNFPALIRLNPGNFSSFSQTLAGGADIRFAKSDGTHLSYQIERWIDGSSNNDTAEIWVKFDTVYGNNSTQSFKMYWGKTGAVDSSSGSAVFSYGNNFLGAWHMGGNVVNSTTGSAGTDASTVDTASGIIGRARAFDGSSQYLNVGDLEDRSSGAIMFWFRPKVTFNSSSSTTMGIWGKTESDAYNNNISLRGSDYSLGSGSTGSMVMKVENNNSSAYVASNTITYNSGTWYHAALVWGNSAESLYVNGSLESAVSGSQTVASTMGDEIGRAYYDNSNISGAGPRYFNGTLDEFRIEKTNRTALWVKLCYENQKVNQTLVQIGGNDYTWDNSTTSGIQVSSGTWGSDNYWTITGGDGTLLTSWPGAGKSATFAGGVDGGPYTITVSGTQNVDSITFLNNTYNLSGGTLNFGTKPGVFVANGKSATISTIISGSPGVSKYGAGTLTLSGSNTYTGNTVINAGTLKNGVNNAFPITTSLVIGANDANDATYDLNGYIQIVTGITDGGTTGGTKQITNTGSAASLVVNTATDYSYSYLITNGTNALNLIKNGSAKFTLAGSNSFTGTITINAGVLSCGVLANGGSGSNIGASSNTASNLVINGGTLQYTGAGVNSDRLFTIGTNGGTIDASGTGALSLTNTGTVGMSGTGTRTLTLTGSNTGNNTLTAIVSNDASSNATSITKSGSGKWVLSGNNTETGPLNISAGTLVVNGLTAYGSAVTVSAGATLAGTGNVAGTVNASGATIAPGNGGTGTLTTGSLTLNGSSVLNYDLGTNRDSMRVNGNLVLDGTLNITNLAGFAQGTYTLMTYTGTLTNNTLEIGSSPAGYTYTISTATAGSVILTVNLPAGSNCTWDISTSAGIQADNGTWGTNNYWTKNGGTVLNAWTSYDNAVFAANQGGGAGGGYNDDHGDGTLTGWTSKGTRTWSETGGFAVPQNNTSNRGFITNDYNCSNDGTYIVIIKGPANTNSSYGGGLFRFTDTTHFYCVSLYESWTGGASANNEIRFIKNSISWSSGTTVKNNLNFSGMNSSYKIKVRLSGSIFTFWLYNPNTSNWDSLNQITDSDNTSGKVGYGYDNYNSWVSFDSSSWADASSPGNPGPYTITVNGTQSVNTITFNAAGYTLSGGTLNMMGASSPAISTAAKGTIGSVVSGSYGLQKTGSDTLVLTGTNTWTGGTTISAGVLQIGSGGTSGTLPGNVTNNSVLIINRSDLFSLNGIISGTGSLLMKGTNVLILSQDNTYTGSTTISSGTLQIGNSGACGSVSGNITDNSALTFNRTGILSFNGVISGSGTLTQNGSGTLILGGVNTYTGTTTVSTGELRISGSTSASSAVTVQSGATLSGSGTVNGTVTISNGGIISPGNDAVGTLTTGNLGLNSTSILNFDLGTSRDSIKVNGNLTLDGNLNIANAGGFGPGVYTLITYTGSCTDAGLSLNTDPLSSYVYSITVNTGTKKVLLTISSNTSMLPLTVVQAAPKCSVYTNNWTLVFDNGKGGGINALTDSIHGLSHGQGNQIGGTQNLYYLEYNGKNSTQNGTWSIIGLGSFWTTIRQSGTLVGGITYTNDYTIHGSGKIFIKSTIKNTTGSDSSGKTIRLACERRPVAVMSISTGKSSANQSPFVLLSSDSSMQNDILLSINDLWAATAAIPNSATGFYNSTAAGYAGYECNTFSLASGQRQSWEFMIDFAHQSWNDSNGVGTYSDGYRTPDSLTYLAGTPAMEQDWEQHISGHWKFDESGTVDTARDASGCNRFGLVSGGSWITGKLGGGLQLNGSQSVTVQNNADYNGNAYFTIMAWIKPTTAISSGSVIFGKYNGTKGWKLTGDGSGRLSVTLDGSTMSGNSTGIGTGTWHHVAVCWRATGTVIFYVDGKVDKVQTGSYTVTTNAENLTIGSGFNGIIDDVRYYNGYEDPMPENTLESIYRNGLRSAEGVYDTRASNDNTLHVLIDGNAIPRRFPVFRIANYWATSKPAAGCVRLNGIALTEGTDYYADLIDAWNVLYIGLNKTIIEDSCRLFIDDASTKGAVVRTTPKMVWGKQNNGSMDYFWAKNTYGSAFDSDQAKQWYINWKMSKSNARCGDPWFLASSVKNPNVQIDTTMLTNLIPGTDDSWGDVCLAINYVWSKTSSHVQNDFTYTVEESSSVRIVLRINERTVGSTNSYKAQTRWTIYPTGQFFKWDSIYEYSTKPMQVYVSACMRDTTGSSIYKNNSKKRCGAVYSGNLQDFAYAWLSLKNQSGYQSQPFVQDTIITWSDATRIGLDFGDWTAAALSSSWDVPTTQFVTYLDMQNSNMSSAFIDSVSNSVQYPMTPVMITGTLLNGGSATEGDLNGDGFNEREGAYVFSSNNNVVHFRLPAHGDTCRFRPAFRITGYTSTYKPQYVVIYRGTDTVMLSEGCHYNAYLNKTKKELVLQIDSVFRDTTNIFISSDKTLAVKLSQFSAQGGDGCDTLRWRTESEQENLGFYLYRRICPEFLDSLKKLDENAIGKDSYYKKLFKDKEPASIDTEWAKVNNKLISGALSGASYGPRDYIEIDYKVQNGVLYEYKLVALDYANEEEYYGPIKVMPKRTAPDKFALFRNFPNPVRTATVIKFALPEKCRVSINIFSLQGRLVKRLVIPGKVLEPGIHLVTWKGDNEFGRPLPAGPYVYRFETGKFADAKVMLLMRR